MLPWQVKTSYTILKYNMLYFIYNNLKVNTFILQDQPFPGFSVLSWDNQCYTKGTLLDIGLDATFIPNGDYRVYGQLWTVDDTNKASEFEYFLGIREGLKKLIEVPVNIECEEEKFGIYKAATFTSNKLILSDFKVVKDGKWMIKRSELSR